MSNVSNSVKGPHSWLSAILGAERVQELTKLCFETCPDISHSELFSTILFVALNCRMIQSPEILSKADKFFLKLVQKDIGTILTNLESKSDWIDLFCMSFDVNLTATKLSMSDSVRLFRAVHLNLRPEQCSSSGKRSSASRNQEEIFDLFQHIYSVFRNTYDLHIFFLELTDGTCTRDESLATQVLDLLNSIDNDLRMLRRDRVLEQFFQIAHILREYRDNHIGN